MRGSTRRPFRPAFLDRMQGAGFGKAAHAQFAHEYKPASHIWNSDIDFATGCQFEMHVPAKSACMLQVRPSRIHYGQAGRGLVGVWKASTTTLNAAGLWWRGIVIEQDDS